MDQFGVKIYISAHSLVEGKNVSSPLPRYRPKFELFTLCLISPLNCRDVTSVCGFTREVLSALIANIETRELRRQQIASQDTLKPERCRVLFQCHERSCGDQFHSETICLEKFVQNFKRINADLPYYYFTSAHDRFYEGPRPSFNDPSTKKRKSRLPRGEQVHAVSFASGRASFPVRGTLTTRPKFHKHPVSVPPPSSMPSYVAEHQMLSPSESTKYSV